MANDFRRSLSQMRTRTRLEHQQAQRAYGAFMGAQDTASPHHPETALLRVAEQKRHVADRSQTVNRSGHTLDAVTLNFDATTQQAVGAAADRMAEQARLAHRQELTGAQRAWLRDIMKPTFSPLTQQHKVVQRAANARRLNEAASVLGTLGIMAQQDFPVDFTLVRRGNQLEGLMQSMPESHNTAIGFLSTHPRNIGGANPTPGVGKALIGQATQLARRAGSTAITLGAEGVDAQGFYQSQGFQHADGRRLSASDFTHGTLPLKLPVRRD